jgi:hypothetical protein
MNFQIDVTSSYGQKPIEAPVKADASANPEVADLLRQILEIQREQLAQQRAAAAAHDQMPRWRMFLSRWHEEFPFLSQNCRAALPHLERCYSQMITDLAEKLNDGDALDNEFAVMEFLDRYGMRLAQLGTILNLVGPLADAGPPSSE